MDIVAEDVPPSIAILEPGYQVVVDKIENRMYIFNDKSKLINMRKLDFPDQSYAQVFGGKKTNPNNAKFILWRRYKLEAVQKCENQRSFWLVIAGNKTPN